MMASPTWIHLCPVAALHLRNTLQIGQSFAWRCSPAAGAAVAAAAASSSASSSAAPSPIFSAVVAGHLVSLRQDGDAIHYRVTASLDDAAPSCESALRDYFQLDIPIEALRKGWAASDARLARVAAVIPGLRVLRQEPVECLFSFITSANNNIARIQQLIDKLRAAHGAYAGEIDGERFFAFPSLETLAAVPEAELRALGFGYRAPYIVKAAAQALERGGAAWLLGLRSASGAVVQSQLIELMGVGRKVADCVALFSLDVKDAIPVDTHVWSITCEHFDPSLRSVKSITPAVYARVGELWRSRFPQYAGWAHSLLFAAELPTFRALLPVELAQEIVAARTAEKQAKKAKKGNAASTQVTPLKRAAVGVDSLGAVEEEDAAVSSSSSRNSAATVNTPVQKHARRGSGGAASVAPSAKKRLSDLL